MLVWVEPYIVRVTLVTLSARKVSNIPDSPNNTVAAGNLGTFTVAAACRIRLKSKLSLLQRAPLKRSFSGSLACMQSETLCECCLHSLLEVRC